MNTLVEAKNSRSKKINKIEEIKSLKSAISVYERLELICKNGLDNLENEDTSFFLKCFGLFLKKDGKFMLRIRIPAGQLKAEQAVKLGELSYKYGKNYIDITTRQQLEFRFLELENLYTILKELDSVGISTFQTGVDNFRNIVTSSFDGDGDTSFITCKPIIDELQSIFLKNSEWIGTLPRKFNTAILGNSINDCNIYGHDCCFILAKKDDFLGFNLYLGGKVGVQAVDTGIFLKKDEVVTTYEAIINLFKQYGFRDNRNKNRLHFLLESVGVEEFVKAIKEFTKINYLCSGEILAKDEYKLNSSSVFDLNVELKALHFPIPSGILEGSDLINAGKLAKSCFGKIRLSIEQSFYIITESKYINSLKESDLFCRYSKYNNSYFYNQIACAGTSYCAFGVIPNKPDAIALSNFLNEEVPIYNAKIRLYWSACPKGCGIHGVGDIGFEGCKVKNDNGEKVDGVHILIGGKVTKSAKEARTIFKSVILSEAKYIVKKIVELYKEERLDDESFESFDSRVLSSLSIDEVVEKINFNK
jgi:ferredoxin-nitrite reductase